MAFACSVIFGVSSVKKKRRYLVLKTRYHQCSLLHTVRQPSHVGCLQVLFGYSPRMRPSVVTVTTCQGMNLPLACRARLAAFSMPPQQGTCIRTMVMP